LGKVALATLLAKLPQLGKVVCVVRAGSDASAEDRFLKDVIASPALDPIRAQHGLGLRDFLRAKVEIHAGDVTRERLGLDDKTHAAIAESLDLVIHCAGLVDFVPPLDKALASNVDGTTHVLELAKRAGKGRCAFLHVSTCFVTGDRGGQIPEELRPGEVPHSASSGFDAFDARREIEEARRLIQRIQTEEVEDPQTQAELWKDAEGSPRKAKRLAEVRAKRRLIEEGYNRAKKWGWANTYCYTKALAERLVDATRSDLGPVAIVRPAVVESALRFPTPGWNQGINTCAPLIWMCSRGVRYWPVPEDHMLDVIPVDLVVNAIVAIGGALLADRGGTPARAHKVYQLGTSATNPLALRRVRELTNLAYRNAELPESIWQKFLRKHTGSVFVSQNVYRAVGLPGLAQAAKKVRGLLERLPLPKSRPFLKSAVEAVTRHAKSAERELEHGSQMLELFMPFMAGPKFAFRTDHARELTTRLAPEDRAALPYDPEKIDWRSYFLDVFIPGLERWTFPELKEREGSAAEATPLFPTLTALIEDSAARYPKRVALRRVLEEGQPEEKITYEELVARIEAGAARLAHAGVRPGDRVGLVAENRPAWVVAYFSVLRAGGTCVPVDSGTDAARLLPILKASRSRAVIASSHRDLARQLKERLAGAGDTGCAVLPLDELTAAADAKRSARIPSLDSAARAPASLIYTSGTTGAPKGVLLSHAAFAHQVCALSAIYPLGPEDRALSVLPLHHVFEFTCGLLLPLARGATVAYAREPSADAIKAGLAAVKPTAMIGVPALFEAWHRQIRRAVKARGSTAESSFDALISIHRGFRKRTGINLGARLFPEVHAQFGGELRYAVSGGAPLPRDVTVTFHGLGMDVFEGYGLTEAGPVLCSNRPRVGPIPGSVGEPIPGVSIRIADPDGEGVGEVLARSPSLLDGYDQDPGRTAQVLRDGWLLTGDLGRLDAKGRLLIVGRSKDVIVDGAGNTVYPDEVEEIYQGCPDVAELAVAGVPLRDEREVVGALVLVRENAVGGAAAARERVRAFFRDVAAQIPSAKRIKVLRFTTRPFPRTATRKVKRDEVARILADLARGETQASSSRRTTLVLRGIVARTLEEVAGVDAESIVPESDLGQDLGLDSIAQADVVSSLAESTGRPAPAELAHVQTIADLVRHFEDQDANAPYGIAPIESEVRPLVFPKPIRALGSEAVDAVVRLSFARGFRTEVRGAGNIPRHSQAIVVANHVSHLDGPLVRYALGDWGKGLVAVGARDYFFKNKLTATYFENFTNVVAFDRRESIRESLGRVVELLEGGHNVLIFPEGTRSVTGRLQAFKAGLGYLVATSRAGVLPVYLAGTFHAAPKGSHLPHARKLGARIGGFMPADVLIAKASGGGRARRDVFQRISEIAREAIVALRDGVAFDVRALPDPEPEPAPSKEERAAARAARVAARSGSEKTPP
jgi:long-chain acyl-CoA synthetase